MESFEASESMVNAKGMVIDSEALKEVYDYWRRKRLATKKPLLRMFWGKPNYLDPDITTSFRSRAADKMKTRRKRNSTINTEKGSMDKLREMRADLV